jgi:hypothetical protein
MKPLLMLALASLVLMPAAAQPPVALGWGDLFVQPAGARGLQPTPQLLAAQGQPVRLVGYMVQREQPQPGRFLLTARPVALSEHADGDADDLPPTAVTVLLPLSQQGRVVAHQPGPVVLTGRLDYGRAEDSTGRISWVRLHLADDALAARPAAAPLHTH